MNNACVLARGMVQQTRGAVVNVSSVAKTAAFGEHASYCASKGALDMPTRFMTFELGRHEVREKSVATTVVLIEMALQE